MWQRKSSGLVSLPDLTNFSMTALKTLLDELTQEPWLQCNQPKKQKGKKEKKNCYFFLWSLFAFLFAFLWQVALFSQAKRKIYTHSKMFSWKNSHSPCLLPLPTMSHCPKKKINDKKTEQVWIPLSLAP